MATLYMASNFSVAFTWRAWWHWRINLRTGAICLGPLAIMWIGQQLE